MMRVWINKGNEAITTGGETFIPGEWLHLDETWGVPCHPDIVEAWVYVQENLRQAKQDVTAAVDAKGEFVEDEKYQADLAALIKERGIDAMCTALDAANKEYGVKADVGTTYVKTVIATADTAEAAKG